MQEGNEQARPDQQNDDGQRQCPPPAPSRLRGGLVWPPCCVTWTEAAHATQAISATDLSSTVVTPRSSRTILVALVVQPSAKEKADGQAREVER